MFAAAATICGADLIQPIVGCQRVFFGPQSQQRIACQCNATHCDSLRFEWPQDGRGYLRALSDKSGRRFELSRIADRTPDDVGQSITEPEPETEPDYLVRLEVNTRLQQVLGFGGAFTDSASQNIGLLSEPVQKRAIDDYFGEHGLDYNMGRLPIAGTDMSSHPYSYDDLPSGQVDLELRHFRLQPEDLIFKIPLIRRINRLRQQRRRHSSGDSQLDPLKLVAASWSAPAWMKSNKHLVQGRLLGNSSGAPFYNAYARYVLRFLEEYERRNISMWALSPQNEPHTPKRTGPKTINFNSNNFEPEEMADYLEHSLIPTLIGANRMGPAERRLRLLLWDDTTDGLGAYQRMALRSPLVSEHLAGLALHWYSQGLRETPYEDLYAIRRHLPARYFMLSTEASFIGKPQPGNWERGQRYARDIIEHLRAGSVAWIDWNLALNTSGGPTWSANILDSAMLVDLERQLYYKNPMFYAIGHVSRFIRPGSHILHSSIESARLGQQTNNITVVAAELEADQLDGDEDDENDHNEGGATKSLARKMAFVALNRASNNCSIRLELVGCKLKAGQKPLVLELPANSITSLAFLC